MIAIDDIDVEYLKVRKDMLQLKKKCDHPTQKFNILLMTEMPQNKVK